MSRSKQYTKEDKGSTSRQANCYGAEGSGRRKVEERNSEAKHDSSPPSAPAPANIWFGERR